MSDVQEYFQELRGVLELNFNREKKDLWQVLYHYWRFYHCTNQLIDAAHDKKEQMKIADELIALGKEFAKHEKEVSDKYTPIFGEAALKAPPSKTLSPSTKRLMLLIEEERGGLDKRLRSIKENKPKIAIRKNRTKNAQKWLKS